MFHREVDAEKRHTGVEQSQRTKWHSDSMKLPVLQQGLKSVRHRNVCCQRIQLSDMRLHAVISSARVAGIVVRLTATIFNTNIMFAHETQQAL